MPAPTLAQYRYPSQRHLTPTHCGNCGARLIAGDVPTADAPLADLTCLLCSRHACVLVHDTMRRPMTPAEWKVIPSEQSKVGRPEGTFTVERVACPGECGRLLDPRKQTHCRECNATLRAANALRTRVMLALDGGRPVHRTDLCLTLHITAYQLSNVVSNARHLGWRIAYADGFYTLEGRP